MELSDARDLGRALLDLHGLTDWHLDFDRARTRAGQCRYGDRTITLSRHLTVLHSGDEVRDTVLHEIAHALVGPRHGHDATWQRTARRIGASGERVLPAESPVVPGDWNGLCPAGHAFTRHRRPERVLLCRRCHGQARNRIIVWTHLGRPVELGRRYQRELEALREARPVSPDPLVANGTRVRVTAPGRYRGNEGTVLRTGRSRYHVQVSTGVLTVPFALVEPVEPAWVGEPDRLPGL